MKRSWQSKLAAIVPAAPTSAMLPAGDSWMRESLAGRAAMARAGPFPIRPGARRGVARRTALLQ
jgi:hypothetical protein